MIDYVVKGIALADFGRKELDIAETELPGLMELRFEYGVKWSQFFGQVCSVVKVYQV